MTRYHVRGIAISVTYCNCVNCGGHEAEQAIDAILRADDENEALGKALEHPWKHWKSDPEVWEASPFEMTATQELAALKRWQESVLA